MGSGKKKKKKNSNQNNNNNNNNNNTPQSAARQTSNDAALADTPETPKFIEDHFTRKNEIQKSVEVITNSPFPSPILSPTPTPAKKVVPKSTLNETKSTDSIPAEAEIEEERDEVTEKKLHFIHEAEENTTTSTTTAVASPSPSQASVGTKIDKIESRIAADPIHSQRTQTTTQASTTLLLETNRDLRSALADSISELASLEEENERLNEQVRKEIDIERPKLIAEACEDLSERLQRAEVAIERERREATNGKFALTELHATKQKLADALQLVKESRKNNANSGEEKANENEEMTNVETERIRVMKEALEKAEDKVLVMFADLSATKVELNRLREENTELKTKHALLETKLEDMHNQREQEKGQGKDSAPDTNDTRGNVEHRHEHQHQMMMSPRAVKEELELASLMKKNAEMRDRESHKKMEEAERQKDAAVKVVEKLRTENEEIRRENEKLRRRFLLEQDSSNTGQDVELARNDKVHSGTERAEKISEKTSVTKKGAVVVAKKRERPSVLRLPSFAWYFISGSDKAPEFRIEEDDSN